MIKKLLKNKTARRHEDRKAELYRSLIRREAKIGGELFGPIPKGGRREFFCLDEHTWVWHEEWIDKNGKRQIKTTRYDVRPSGVLKAQDGQTYQYVTPQEGLNFRQAVKLYNHRVKTEMYNQFI